MAHFRISAFVRTTALLVVLGLASSQPISSDSVPEAHVLDFNDMILALSDASISTIRIPATLETPDGRAAPSVEVSRPVLIKPSDDAGETVWNQRGLKGVISVLPGGLISVEGMVTFTGCSEPSSISGCSFSSYLPGVFHINGGTVSLNSTQLVCKDPDDLIVTPDNLILQLEQDAGIEVAEIKPVASRKVVLTNVAGCANGKPGSGGWQLSDVAAIWDLPGCYERGVAVSTGPELQSALHDDLSDGINPVQNIYIAENIKMNEDEWPFETNIYREVNITGCGGVVWDTNLIGQRIFVWSGGHMHVDGAGNFTVANSKPSSRRGNVWQLVGAWSAETGNITLKDLTVTSTAPSPFHSSNVDLNPPQNWPLPCCTVGELEHINPTELFMPYWRMDKAEWVLASAGVVLPENAFWNFYNVQANVRSVDPCFEDFSIGVSNAKQLFDALNDPELKHIELLASMDLQDWTSMVTVSRPDVIIRGCNAIGDSEPFSISVPSGINLIQVVGDGTLSFEQDILLVFEEPRVAIPDEEKLENEQSFWPFVLIDGGQMGFSGVILDCRQSANCIIGNGLEAKLLDGASGPNITVIDDMLYSISYADIPYSAGDGVHYGIFKFRDVLAQLPEELEEPENGLSGGAIAAIAVGAMVMLVALLAITIAALRRKSLSLPNEEAGLAVNRRSTNSSIGNSLGSNSSTIWSKLGNLEKSSADDARVQILELLGTGGSAKVYRANWKGVIVAYKVIQLPARTAEQGQLAKVESEAEISVALRHPNVVQTYSYKIKPVQTNGNETSSPVDEGTNQDTVQNSKHSSVISQGGVEQTFESKSASQVVMYEANIMQEFCNKGSLYKALEMRRLPGQDTTSAKPCSMVALQLSLDIACGMRHIHSLQIIHGDLKSQNILLLAHDREDTNVHLIAKVADFGLSQIMDTSQTHVSNVHSGTVTHMAPELLMTGKLGMAADVYAFGIVLYEIFTGQKVFEGMTSIAISHDVVQKDIRPQFSPDMSVKIVDLACRCWHKDPEARPDFAKIMAELEDLKTSFGAYDSNSPHGSGDCFTLQLDTRLWSESANESARHTGVDMKHLQMGAAVSRTPSLNSSGGSVTSRASASSLLPNSKTSKTYADHISEAEMAADDTDDEEEEEDVTNTVILDPKTLKNIL